MPVLQLQLDPSGDPDRRTSIATASMMDGSPVAPARSRRCAFNQDGTASVLDELQAEY
jgi:hypothetical protein